MKYSVAAGLMFSTLMATAMPAALVPTLSSTTGQVYTYNVMLTGDEGLSTSAFNPASGNRIGSQFVIYDFAGYVSGSIFSSNALFTATAELVSPPLPMLSGASDDPALYNLRFTYTGPDFHTSGGPYANMSEGMFGAQTTLAMTAVSDFSSVAVNNSGATGTAAFNQGSITVPGTVPEPAGWAMMVGGFGLLGATMRHGRRTVGFA